MHLQEEIQRFPWLKLHVLEPDSITHVGEDISDDCDQEVNQDDEHYDEA